MMPFRLGIHVPYRYDEATRIACSLADMAASFGLSVDILSPARVRTPDVHFRWDSAALDPDSGPMAFESWCSKCPQIIWMQGARRRVEAAQMAGCHNVLLVLPNYTDRNTLKALDYFDRIVCPSELAAEWIQYEAPFRVQTETIPWDLSAAVNGGPVTLPLQLIVQLVVDDQEDPAINILKARRINHRVVLMKDGQGMEHRLRRDLSRETNLTIDLRKESQTSQTILESLAHGHPVVALARPHVLELAKTLRGLLAIQRNELEDLLDNRGRLRALYRGSWPETEERRRAFQEYWVQLWRP